MVLERRGYCSLILVRVYGGEKGRREEEENPSWNLYGIVWKFLMSCLETHAWNSCLDYLYGTTINLFLSKLCRENHIKNVVGWFEMSVMVYFKFWWSWFWFERKFPVEKGQIWPILRSARHPYA